MSYNYKVFGHILNILEGNEMATENPIYIWFRGFYMLILNFWKVHFDSLKVGLFCWQTGNDYPIAYIYSKAYFEGK